jgi:AcrR family transcriptional regulator
MSTRVPRTPSARGRQAEARRNDAAVLEAARDVFSTQGSGAPVAAVAERAGVGMGSLYRRYGSKAELLQQLCVLAMEQAQAAADEALAAEDPWTGLTGYVSACVELRTGALAPLAGQIKTTPEMLRVYRKGRGRLEEIVARAHRDNSLRADATALDIAWLIEQFSRRAADAIDAEEEASIRARLLAIALDGLRAPRSQPLPGRPPSRTHYEGRWRRSS